MQPSTITVEVRSPVGLTIPTQWPSGSDAFDERAAHLLGKFRRLVERAGGSLGEVYPPPATIHISLNSVRLVDLDPEGVGLVVMGEREEPVYAGTPEGASRFLRKCVPVGRSVTVRHVKGLRSCMNKPSLWEDVKAY